jgi:hypothetical protein
MAPLWLIKPETALLQSAALFFWYVPVFLVVLLFFGAESIFSRR